MGIISKRASSFKASNVIAFPREWQASCDELPIWWSAAQVAQYARSHRKLADIKKRLADVPGMVMIDDYLARKVTEHLGGKWHGTHGRAPGPGHSKDDDSLKISPHESDPDDVVLHSFCGDDWKPIKDDLRARGILPDKRKAKNGKDRDPRRSSAPTIMSMKTESSFFRFAAISRPMAARPFCNGDRTAKASGFGRQAAFASYPIACRT